MTFRNKKVLLSTHELFITPGLLRNFGRVLRNLGRFFETCELKRTVRSSFETSK
jgi:hypothetical protein